ncbi:hypothetical protein ABIF90_000148 [Bradyrhizobium japonicum]
MAQVNSESSTALPARPAGARFPSGLARQQRRRLKALKTVAQLREEASAEIERLIAFLDASDLYAMTELELNGDEQDEGISA